MSSRSRVVAVVFDAMTHSNQVIGDPDQLLMYAELAVDTLLAHGPAADGGSYRAGWLFAYGRVHDVTETDSQDGGYFVFTRDKDLDDRDYNDEEDPE